MKIEDRGSRGRKKVRETDGQWNSSDSAQCSSGAKGGGASGWCQWGCGWRGERRPASRRCQGGVVSDWLILDGLLRCGVGGTKAQRIQRTIALSPAAAKKYRPYARQCRLLCAPPSKVQPSHSSSRRSRQAPAAREQEGLQQIQLPDGRSACSLCRFFLGRDLSHLSRAVSTPSNIQTCRSRCVRENEIREPLPLHG